LIFATICSPTGKPSLVSPTAWIPAWRWDDEERSLAFRLDPSLALG